MTHPRTARRLAPIFAFAAGLTAASPAVASSPTDQAAAETLFREGRKLAEAGDYEHACPRFVESQRLDPTVGTQLSIGACYEKAGKLASAWGAFKAAEMAARDAGAKGQEGEAQRRATALAQKLARLAIVVAPAAKVPGFEVRRDGELVGEGQWGSAMPADTGWHKIEVTAPGKKAWSTTVRIEADGSSASVTVPELEAAGAEGPGAAAASFWGGQRIAGVAVGGVGVVGLVVGAVFGARAISKKADADKQCLPDTPNVCYPAGMALRHDEKVAGNTSTAMLIAGGVLAAGGVVLALTAPGTAAKKDALRLQVGPAVGGVAASFGGRW